MELSDKTSDACAFGPFYPAILQPIVDHAERLWALVAVHELAPPSDEWATAWLVGRSEEIARVASEVLRSWHEAKTRDTEAAAELQAYLALVHGGLGRRAWVAPLPRAARRQRKGPQTGGRGQQSRSTCPCRTCSVSRRRCEIHRSASKRRQESAWPKSRVGGRKA